MSHVSVEPDQIALALASPETIKIAEAMREKYKGRKIILGIDVCQRLSGGALKMAAFEKLLADYGDIGRRVVLVQRSLLPGVREGDESTTSGEMKRMCEELNNHYGTAGGEVVVDYEETPSMSLNQRVGLYLASDVFLLTSIREGLNLMPLEYIYSRKELPDAGVVVTSEFSACCSLLNGAIKINPFSAQLVADALDTALDMDLGEKAHRRQRDLPFISSRPSASWTKHILGDLWQFKMNHGRRENIQFPRSLKDNTTGSCDALERSFVEAGTSKVLRKSSRVFILDYGGTILAKERVDIYHKQSLSAISGRKPTDAMLAAVQKLSEDPNNAILVVTGITRAKLGGIFNNMKNVTVATSIGLVYSWGSHMLTEEERDRGTLSTSSLDAYNTTNGSEVDVSGRPWECLDFDIDWNGVREVAEPIITRFTARTNGTCQSPRIPGIGWSYFGADPDFGDKQATQLTAELEAALALYDVKVVSLIQGSIEIVPKQLNKGLFVKKFLERVQYQRAGQLPYMGLVMGDEPSDDTMFQAYAEILSTASSTSWYSNGGSGNGSGGTYRDRDMSSSYSITTTLSSSSSSSPGVHAFTVTVGKKESAADFYVNDVQ
eukprot:gene3536-7030_t